MSLESEDQLDLLDGTTHGSSKRLKTLYTRDFLLSFSDLEQCKKLPSGFDQSLLSEFEDAPQERFRVSGSLSSQSYRHNEYSSSPPDIGELNSYSRGIHGRWDSRSSGRSDRDSDSQSDWDSDSVRRYPNQSRRPWQVPEHDGLLGSGSFPRPTGHAAGTMAPKSRSGDNYQLNRSNEPYHPPRPYKAVPHSRRDTNDSYNDETFGSSDSTSEDRAEEERKRRASFELMRKEQQQALQEKQRTNQEKRRDDFDITSLLEDRKEDNGLLKQSNGPNEPVIQHVNDSNKSGFPTSAPATRPLVPPGFSSGLGEKNVGTKSSTHPLPPEVGDELASSLLHAKGNPVLSRTSSNLEDKQYLENLDLVEQQAGIPSVHDSVNSKNEKILNLSSAVGASRETVGMNGEFFMTSKLSEAIEGSVNSKVIEPSAKDVLINKLVGESSPAQSTSILEKLFNSALTLNGGDSSSLIENQDVKVDDTFSPHVVPSSKFAQWFLEEEKKPVDDHHSDRPSDLLSLIVGGEKGSSHAFDVKDSKHILPSFPFQRSKVADGHTMQNLKSVNVENTDQLQITDNSELVPAVLTCEDLEQSILSEVTVNNSTMPPLVKWSGPDSKSEQKKADVDSHASQHLLSLLQKGTGVKVMAPSPSLGINSLVKSEPKTTKDADSGDSSSTGKPLTLETLFGTAFMKELKSAGALPSEYGGSVGPARLDVSDPHGLPLPIISDGLLPSTAGMGSSVSSHGTSMLALNQRQHVIPLEEHLVGFGLPPEKDPSQFQTELGSNPGGLDSSEIRLPEEESLISVGDNLHDFMSVRNLNKSELLPSRDSPLDITGKLTPLNSVFREERPIIGVQEGPPFPCGHDTREFDVHYQPSSPQLHPPQLNHPGMFHLLDSHRSLPSNFSPQTKFMTSENMHRDNANHQFPAKMIHPPLNRPSSGPSGFDPPIHNPLLQQLQMPGNFPPPHLSHGFPRGVPLPQHPSNQGSGFRQEVNTMQGFPFGQRQLNPSLGGIGIPLRVPDVGGGTNHPEALQRLIEMELRSNPKQLHPFNATGHSQGMYGHELDMGFGYR